MVRYSDNISFISPFNGLNVLRGLPRSSHAHLALLPVHRLQIGAKLQMLSAPAAQ